MSLPPSPDFANAVLISKAKKPNQEWTQPYREACIYRDEKGHHYHIMGAGTYKLYNNSNA